MIDVGRFVLSVIVEHDLRNAYVRTTVAAVGTLATAVGLTEESEFVEGGDLEVGFFAFPIPRVPLVPSLIFVPGLRTLAVDAAAGQGADDEADLGEVIAHDTDADGVTFQFEFRGVQLAIVFAGE